MLPAELRRALAARSDRAAGRSSPASRSCTKSTMRRQASRCASFHSPVHPGVMRPSGETQVISVNTSPAPPSGAVRRSAPGASRPARRPRRSTAPSATPPRGSTSCMLAQLERQEHRRPRARARRRAARASARSSATKRGSRSLQVLVADALAAGQQAVGELPRRQVRVARDVLEPLHAVARRALQLEHFERCAPPGRRSSAAVARRARAVTWLHERRWHPPSRAWCRSRCEKCAVCAASPISTRLPWCQRWQQHAVEVQPRRAAQVAARCSAARWPPR